MIDALWSGFNQQAAFGHVEFISQFWRLPGNHGYDVSIDRIRERLTSAGFAPGAEGSAAAHVGGGIPESGALLGALGRDRGAGAERQARRRRAVARQGAPRAVHQLLLDRRRRASSRRSSTSGPAATRTTPARTLKGAVVLGDADAGQLWRKAVVGRRRARRDLDRAAALPRRRSAERDRPTSARPSGTSCSGAASRTTRRARASASRPRRAPRRACARRSRDDPARRVGPRHDRQPVLRPARSARSSPRFPAAIAPDERIVIAAHVQEPGANDNASGVATRRRDGRARWRNGDRGGPHAAARRGRITFLFITEISGSRQWLQSHAGGSEAGQVHVLDGHDRRGRRRRPAAPS